MRLLYQGFHILQGTKRWINVLVIADVVAHIHLWAVVHWTYPKDICAKVAYVVKLGRDARKVAEAVIVRVFEAHGVNLLKPVNLPKRPPGSPVQRVLT